MKSKLRHYVYFDTVGIERLHAQLAAYEEVDLTLVSSDKTMRGAGRRISPKLSAKFFATGFEVAGETESHGQDDASFEVRRNFRRPDEQKLAEVEAHALRNDDLRQASSPEALYASAQTLPAFCLLRDFPVMLKVPAGMAARDMVIKEQMVVLETAHACDGAGPRHVFIAGSLAKFQATTKGGDDDYRFGKTSHMGIFVAELENRVGAINVFGHARRVLDHLHVKPYAIWF